METAESPKYLPSPGVPGSPSAGLINAATRNELSVQLHECLQPGPLSRCRRVGHRQAVACVKSSATRQRGDQILRQFCRRAVAIPSILRHTSLHDGIERTNLRRRAVVDRGEDWRDDCLALGN